MPHSDQWIISHAHKGMIRPFEPTLVRKIDDIPAVSYGTASYAYDMRIDFDCRMPVGGTLDVKRPELAQWVTMPVINSDLGDYIEIPAHGFILAQTVERWHIPDDVYVIVVGKSSYARNALVINCTPLEPGWEGILNLELLNTSSLPVRVYIGEGIAAAIFFQGHESCLTTYADRGGKYQGQDGIVHGKV